MNGPEYTPAYFQQRARIESWCGPQLLAFIDGLYGRAKLPTEPTLEEIRDEALRQHELHTTAPEWFRRVLEQEQRRHDSFPRTQRALQGHRY